MHNTATMKRLLSGALGRLQDQCVSLAKRDSEQAVRDLGRVISTSARQVLLNLLGAQEFPHFMEARGSAADVAMQITERGSRRVSPPPTSGASSRRMRTAGQTLGAYTRPLPDAGPPVPA